MLSFLRRLATWIVCAAPALLGLIPASVVRYAWGEKWQRMRGITWAVIASQSWPTRTWYKYWGATVLGPGVGIVSPGYLGTGIENHEAVHDEQSVAAAVAGFVICLILCALSGGFSVAGLLIWATCWHTQVFGAMAAAKLRGESSPYVGSHLEEAARGETRPDLH